MPAPESNRSTPAVLLVALLLAACASPQPVVYRTPQTPATEAQRMERDTAACRDQARRVVGLNQREAARTSSPRKAGEAGAVAFVAAAAAGLAASTRDVWQRARGAAAGGAAGMATKVALDWNVPDEVHEKYVERCMKDRGHEVLGWR